jgi:hypothetical protein
MAFVGMALFVAAAVSLALSMRGNERDSDRAKAVVQAQTFREELDRSRSEKPGKGE